MSFDVIVVGARCAGSSLGMLLARRGHRVLVVDRAEFPSDTLSTHFIWPRGLSYLNRWGLLEQVRATTPVGQTVSLQLEDVKLVGEIPRALVEERLRRVHGSGEGATEQFCSMRRTHLDVMLVDAARAAGAEVRTGVSLEGLLTQGDRVTGVQLRGANGGLFTEHAQVVVGADGRRSTVARLLELQEEDLKPRCTFAYWGYWTGLGEVGATLVRKGRLGAAVAPTNDGQHMVLGYGPIEWASAFKADIDGNHLRLFELLAPELAERLRSGHRVERMYGVLDQASFMRRTSGPGWLLVGDAASFKDQCTASGITHAFRDAELAAEEISRGLQQRPLDRALHDYSRRRYLDSVDYHRFVSAQAEMNPARPEELELARAVADDPVQTGRYLAMFGDTLPVRAFMARRSIAQVLRHRPQVTQEEARAHDQRIEAAYPNPFAEPQPWTEERAGLTRSILDYAQPVERNLLDRGEAYFRWMDARQELGTWQYTRTLTGAPGPTSPQLDERGRQCTGVNFASQDYLSLTTHPGVVEAAARALRELGPHSAGSPLALGNTTESVQLERDLRDFLGREGVLLYPTGWAAGVGSMTGLIRQEDHVLLDRFAHNCLAMGARAASGNVRRYEHVDVDSLRYWLEEIRARDTRNGILVVTEGLFSMESTSPRLAAMQMICREFDAVLLVDVAHDLGAMGPGGTGQMGLQGVLADIDMVMGSFSKTFCSNGGFVAVKSPSLHQYLKQFSAPHMFSNGLAPAQAAAVRTALGVVRSAEGDRRRSQLDANVDALRAALRAEGLTVLGTPSAIVPVLIGDEKVARLVHRQLFQRGVAVNMVEYPVVEAGSARIRLQVMANHTPEHCARAGRIVGEAFRAATEEAERLLGHRLPALQRSLREERSPEPRLRSVAS